jgi:hypothetical protein
MLQTALTLQVWQEYSTSMPAAFLGRCLFGCKTELTIRYIHKVTRKLVHSILFRQ